MSYLKYGLGLMCILIIGACATSGPVTNSKTGAETKGAQISITEGTENLSFWLSYGLGMQSCSEEFEAYAFEIEYCAFQLASLINSEINENDGAKPNQFGQMLLKAQENGYLKELAYEMLSNNSMFTDYNLKTSEFKAWYQSQYPNSDIPGNTSARVEVAPQEIDEDDVEEVVIADEFPVAFGNFVFVKESDFGKKSLGKSLRFQHNNEASHIDAYVYPVVFSGYADKKINPVFDGITSAKQGIIAAFQQGSYQDLRMLKEEYWPVENTAFGEYSFSRSGENYRSVIYLTEHNSMYIKVRGSFLIENANDYRKDILELMNGLKNNIR